MGMYVSPERVVVNGRLVAFKGERMTEADAKKRGLVKEKPARKTRKASK